MGRQEKTTKTRLRVMGCAKGNGVMLAGEEETLKGNGKALICNEEPSKADADA